MFRKIVSLIFIRGLGSGSSILINLLIARMVSPAEAGVVFFAIAVSQFAAIAARFGMDILSLRSLAEMKANAIDRQSASRFLSKTHGIALMAIVPVTALALTFAYNSKVGHSSIREIFLIIGLCVGSIAYINISSESLKGAGAANEGLFWQTLSQPVLLLLLVFVFSPDFFWLPVFISLSFLLTALGSVYWCHRKIFSSFQSSGIVFDSPSFLSLGRLGFPFFVISVTSGIVDIADTLLLGFIGRPEDVGVYYVCAKVAALSSIILFLVNSFVAPQIASLHALKKHFDLLALMKKFEKGMLCLAIGLIGGIFFFGESILRLFGENYSLNGFFALRVLAVGYFFVLAFGPVGTFMTMTGQQNFYMRINVVACVANIAINLLLIPKYGLNGACFGSALSLMIKNSFLYLYYKKSNLNG